MPLPNTTPPPTNHQDKTSFPVLAALTGRKALNILESLRAGQPAPEMMMATSPVAQRAADHIRTRIYGRISVVKVVVGAMGGGKTTFLQNVAAAAEPAGCIPIPHTASTTGRLPIDELTLLLIGDEKIMTSAIERVQEIVTQEDADKLGELRALARTSIANTNTLALGWLLYRLMDTPYENDIPEGLADDYIGAISRWIQGNIRGELIALIKNLSGHSLKGIGAYNQKFGLHLIKAHLTLYNIVGLYPLWLVDEFESYIALSRQSRDRTLGFIRDILDILAEHSVQENGGAGGLILFTTPDGQRMMEGYPALADRVRGSTQFTVSSPTWRTTDLSRWDVDLLIDYLCTLFGQAASVDPIISGRIAKVLDHDRRDDDFLRAAKAILEDPDLEPRNRIKTLLCDLLDLIPEGDDMLQHGAEAETPYQAAKRGVIEQLNDQAELQAAEEAMSAELFEAMEAEDQEDNNVPTSLTDESPIRSEPIPETPEHVVKDTSSSPQDEFEDIWSAPIEEEDDLEFYEYLNDIDNSHPDPEIACEPEHQIGIWENSINQIALNYRGLPKSFAVPTVAANLNFQTLPEIQAGYKPDQSSTLTSKKIEQNRSPSAMANNLTAMLDNGYTATELQSAVDKNPFFTLLSRIESNKVIQGLERIMTRYPGSIPVRVFLTKRQRDDIEDLLIQKYGYAKNDHSTVLSILQALAINQYSEVFPASMIHWVPSQESKADIERKVFESFKDLLKREVEPELEQMRRSNGIPDMSHIDKHMAFMKARSLSKPVLYNYQETIGSLRHFALCYMAEAKVVPDLVALDHWVLDTYKQISLHGDLPPTSRKGIFFYSTTKGWIKKQDQQKRLHNQSIHSAVI